eukprot:gene43820-54452_t
MTLKPHRRRILSLAAVAAASAAGLLVSCASLIGPRQFEVPLERLQKNLGQRFPVNHRVLGVFDVQLSNPQVSTVGQNDRVALSAELTVSPMLVRQSWRGSLALSGKLVVEEGGQLAGEIEAGFNSASAATLNRNDLFTLFSSQDEPGPRRADHQCAKFKAL